MLMDPNEAFNSLLAVCSRPATAAHLRVEEAIARIARGELVVVLDDAGRENEGDLIGAADLMTPARIAFMVNHTTGILCVALDASRADALALPPMVRENADPHGTAFTVTCDALGTGTGVSAEARARTITLLGSRDSVAADFRRPGHVFPLRARRGGVIERPGHTEAAYDLARLARRSPVGVLSELVNPDGSMMRGWQLDRFACEHGLLAISVGDLIDWRIMREAAWHGCEAATAEQPPMQSTGLSD